MLAVTIMLREAMNCGLSIGAVRSKLSRGTIDLPPTRTVHTDSLLSRMVQARRNVLTVLDAIHQGPSPRQKPISAEDRAAVAAVAEEIRDAAGQLVETLGGKKLARVHSAYPRSAVRTLAEADRRCFGAC